MRFAFLYLLLMGVAAGTAHASIEDIEALVMEKDYKQAGILAQKEMRQTTNVQVQEKARYYLGLSYIRLGQYVKGRREFLVVMKNTQQADLYEKAALGMFEGYYMAGYYKEALDQMMTLQHKYPKSSAKSLIYLKIARANLKLKRWKAAREYLNRIVDEFSQSLEAPIAKSLIEEKEYFTVQVGSFLDQDKAVKLVEQLKNDQRYAYIVQLQSAKGETFYRVRVGQFTSLNDAQALQNDLSKRGLPALIYP